MFTTFTAVLTGLALTWPPVAAAAGSAGGRPLTVSLPAPTLTRPIGTVAVRLVDRSRRDPLAGAKPYRELMVSLWYPARAGGGGLAPHMAPYMA